MSTNEIPPPKKPMLKPVALTIIGATLLVLLSTWRGVSSVEVNARGFLQFTPTVFQYFPLTKKDPTPTPTPTPPLIFFEDFTSPHPDWPQGELGDCEFEVRSGVYRVEVKEDDQECIVPAFPIPHTPNGVFSMRIRRTTDEDQELRYGFYFAAGTRADEDRWKLEIYPFVADGCDDDDEGYYWLSAREDEEDEYFDDDCTDDIDLDEDEWNDVTVFRNGPFIDIYINGEFQDDYNESYNIGRGYFNLYVVGLDDLSSSSPGIVEFDDILIEPYRTPPNR